MGLRRLRTTRTAASIFILMLLHAPGLTQEHDPAAVIRLIDAAVAARFENIFGFTDVEHYAVYRGNDETHPVAEMTVKDTYKKGSGKTYSVLSESGSSILLHFGLKPLLENEQTINQPGNVEKSWFTSANYAMTLKSGNVQKLNGRDCFALDVKPKEVAPNLIIGTIWVDANDGTLVQIDGISSKNPSAFSGATHLMRQYTSIDGYSMAIHARAESDSALFGRTVVTIDYSDYKLEILTRK
jgi:hypothetical protein